MSTPQVLTNDNTVFSTVPLEQPVSTGTAIASELVNAGVVAPSIEKRQFITEREKSLLLGVIFSPITVLAWLLSLPIRAFTWIVITVKTRRYDPEKRVCPACGFRGDSGTDGKTCRVEFVDTTGPERAGLQHFCFKCGCDRHISPLFLKADAWLPRITPPKQK